MPCESHKLCLDLCVVTDFSLMSKVVVSLDRPLATRIALVRSVLCDYCSHHLLLAQEHFGEYVWQNMEAHKRWGRCLCWCWFHVAGSSQDFSAPLFYFTFLWSINTAQCWHETIFSQNSEGQRLKKKRKNSWNDNGTYKSLMSIELVNIWPEQMCGCCVWFCGQDHESATPQNCCQRTHRIGEQTNWKAQYRSWVLHTKTSQMPFTSEVSSKLPSTPLST